VQVEGNYCPYRSPDHAHHCNPPGLILVDHGDPASPVPPVQPRVRRTLIELARNLRSQSPPVPNTPRTIPPKKRFTLPVLAVRSGTGTQPMKRPNKPRSQTVLVPGSPGTAVSNKWYTLSFPRVGRRNREQQEDSPSTKNAITTSPQEWDVWVPLDLTPPMCPQAPPLSPVLSTHHDSSPSDWKFVIGGLIYTIFSDRNEVKEIGQLSGGDAQVFIDMVYEVRPCPLSSPKITFTNFRSASGQASEFLDPALWTRCLQVLSKICGRQILLPRSLSIQISWDPAEPPLYQAGCADVWKSISCGRGVAVKVPRLYRSVGHEKIRKVSSGPSLTCGVH